jgi:hypothetical protein
MWLPALARHPGFRRGAGAVSVRVDAIGRSDFFVVGLVEPSLLDFGADISGVCVRGVWCVVCGVWCVVCGVWCVVCV